MSRDVHVSVEGHVKRTSKGPRAKLHADLLSVLWLQKIEEKKKKSVTNSK